MKLQRQQWFLSAHIFLSGCFGLLAGCDDTQPCRGRDNTQVSVVLTFDDGPLTADLAHPEELGAPEDAIRPLQDILSKLEQRGVQAVFFVEGPRGDAADEALRDVFAQGLLQIHQAGHYLGYHCMRHDAALWANPLAGPEDLDRKSSDLTSLQNYLDESLVGTGLTQAQMFSPVFRQPFGGSGISRWQGWTIAEQRGWVYRGFGIDSLDWIHNVEADPALSARLDIETEEALRAFVIQHLREGVRHHKNAKTVDVLLHVNQLTAKHLDDWMDVLAAAFSEAGKEVVFEVPPCYVTTQNLFVDRTIFSELLDVFLFSTSSTPQ